MNDTQDTPEDSKNFEESLSEIIANFTQKKKKYVGVLQDKEFAKKHNHILLLDFFEMYPGMENKPVIVADSIFMIVENKLQVYGDYFFKEQYSIEEGIEKFPWLFI